MRLLGFCNIGFFIYVFLNLFGKEFIDYIVFVFYVRFFIFGFCRWEIVFLLNFFFKE